MVEKDRALLFEALSWLDSLPSDLPSSLFEPRLQLRSVPLQPADDHEDEMHPLALRRSSLEYGWRRWRRYYLTRQGRRRQEEEVHRLPAWRRFLVTVRALRKWRRRWAFQLALTQRLVLPLRVVGKQRKYLRFWLVRSRLRRRAKRLALSSWANLYKRVCAVKHLMQRRELRSAVIVWRRRARWPRVAQQWRRFHLRLSFASWRCLAGNDGRFLPGGNWGERGVMQRRRGPASLGLQRAGMELGRQFHLVGLLRQWRRRAKAIHRHRLTLFKRLQHFLPVMRKMMRQVWLRTAIAWRLQKDQLQLAETFGRTRRVHSAWSLWIRQVRWRSNHLTHPEKCRNFQRRKWFKRWFDQIRFKYIAKQDDLLRLRRLRGRLRYWRTRIQLRKYEKKLREVNELVSLRLAVRQWQSWSQAKSAKFSLAVADSFRRRQALRRFLLLQWREHVVREIKVRSAVRRMRCQSLLRRWRRQVLVTQRVFRQIHYRADLRYQIYTAWKVFRLWYGRSQRSADLRRRLKVYQRLHSLRYSSLHDLHSHRLEANHHGDRLLDYRWLDEGDEGGEADRKLVLVHRNRKVMAIIWQHWAGLFVPARRWEREQTQHCAIKQNFLRMRRCWESWFAEYDRIACAKHSLFRAMHCWRKAKECRAWRRDRLRRLLHSCKKDKGKAWLALRWRYSSRLLSRHSPDALLLVVYLQRWLRLNRARASQQLQVKRCQGEILRRLHRIQCAVQAVETKHIYFQCLSVWRHWRRSLCTGSSVLKSIQLRMVGRKSLRAWVETYNRQVMVRTLGISLPHSLSDLSDTAAGISIIAFNQSHSLLNGSIPEVVVNPTSRRKLINLDQKREVLSQARRENASPSNSNNNNTNNTSRQSSCSTTRTSRSMFKAGGSDHSLSTLVVDTQSHRRGYYAAYKRRVEALRAAPQTQSNLSLRMPKR
eukprot:gene4849-5317_t